MFTVWYINTYKSTLEIQFDEAEHRGWWHMGSSMQCLTPVDWLNSVLVF